MSRKNAAVIMRLQKQIYSTSLGTVWKIVILNFRLFRTETYIVAHLQNYDQSLFWSLSGLEHHVLIWYWCNCTYVMDLILKQEMIYSNSVWVNDVNTCRLLPMSQSEKAGFLKSLTSSPRMLPKSTFSIVQKKYHLDATESLDQSETKPHFFYWT